MLPNRSAAAPALLGLLIIATSAVLTTAFTPGNPIAGAVVGARRSYLFASSPLPAEFARDAASKVLPSVASVSPVGVRNITSRGTGFVVGFPSFEESKEEGGFVHVLTAAHVASPGTRLSVSFNSAPEIEVPASIVGRDVGADLALIRVELPGGSDGAVTVPPPPLQFYEGETDKSNPPIGTLAFACGYPSGMDGAAFTMGVVCGTSRGLEGAAPWMGSRRRESTGDAANSTREVEEDVMFQNVTFVVTDASMAPGMSGGPVTDVNGSVMGMCALVRPDLRALGNYAVSASACIRFLEEMSSKVRAASSAEKGAAEGGAHAGPKGYRVVLFNDRMNKKERVSRILRDVAKLDQDEAESVMMAAHRTGRGVVTSFGADGGDASSSSSGRDSAGAARALAEELCELMRREDVLVEVEELLI